jgi:hypothetical protein
MGFKMKKILFIFLLTIGFGYAQQYQHSASIKVLKDSISSNETFTATYSISEIGGYIYIGVQNGRFETIGTDRWEGEIKLGETKTVTFTVKIKENWKAELNKKVALRIGFSFRPFGEFINDGVFDEVIIKITDYDELKQINESKKKLNKTGMNNVGELHWSDSIINNNYIPDTTVHIQQHYF